MSNRELAIGLGCGLTVVRTKCYELGLKRMELEYWTEEQTDFLLANYKTKGDVELAEIFNDRWNKNKGWTKKHIEKKRKYLKLKRTEEEIHQIQLRNIQAGRYSVNHWMRWYGRAAKIGTIKTWYHEKTHPFKVIKTENGYVHLNRKLWEENFGPIPEDHQITYKDGNPLNCSPENLECIPIGNHPNFRNASRDLTDQYIAGQMSRNDIELREYLLQHPDLLDLKRQQLLLQRTINEYDRKELDS